MLYSEWLRSSATTQHPKVKDWNGLGLHHLTNWVLNILKLKESLVSQANVCLFVRAPQIVGWRSLQLLCFGQWVHCFD